MMKPVTFVALVVLLTTPAFAHVTLEVQRVTPGAGYKAVFRVPHGCDGAATTALKIQMPEGFVEAKPMPHPGWTLSTKSGDYARTYTLYGADVKTGVTEVDFTGGNLPDAWYDEFVVNGTIADSFKPGDVIYFPTVQECGATAATHWIEIPKDGQKIDDLKHPAPHLDVIAKP